MEERGGPEPEPLTRLRGTVVVRPGTARALGATMIAAGAFVAGAALLGGWQGLRTDAAPAALFALLGWAAFWRPHVAVSDGGVSIVNTWRTIEVPWPALEEVDGRYGLRLRTAYGRFTAWGAAAPAGRSRFGAPVSAASGAVEERLGALRQAGYLDDPRLERPAPVVVWHLPVIAATAVLAVLAVLAHLV